MVATFFGQIFLVKHNEFSSDDEKGYKNLCFVFAFFLLYVQWIKLVLTVCLTVHIFSLAVLLKNLKKCEPLYVVASLLVPAVIAAVPLATKTYGLAGSWCWIKDRTNNCDSSVLVSGAVEQIALWYGPCMVLLLLCAVAMAIMMIAVVCRLRTHRARLRRDKNWKLLKQLLPLSAYPILFLIFLIAPFVNRLYGRRSSVVG